MVRARRGPPQGEGWQPHRPWAPVLTTPRGAHRTPGRSARGRPRHGRAAQRSRCRRGRAAPTRWPSIPGRSTARRESTSHNPPAQRPIPPGCTLRPSAPLTGEAALPPKAGQPGFEASTPGPVAWSRKAQNYSSLGPHATPVPVPARLRGGTRPASPGRPRRRQRCPSKRGRHAIWCPFSTTNASIAIVLLTVGRDRVNISDKR